MIQSIKSQPAGNGLILKLRTCQCRNKYEIDWFCNLIGKLCIHKSTNGFLFCVRYIYFTTQFRTRLINRPKLLYRNRDSIIQQQTTTLKLLDYSTQPVLVRNILWFDIGSHRITIFNCMHVHAYILYTQNISTYVDTIAEVHDNPHPHNANGRCCVCTLKSEQQKPTI